MDRNYDGLRERYAVNVLYYSTSSDNFSSSSSSTSRITAFNFLSSTSICYWNNGLDDAIEEFEAEGSSSNNDNDNSNNYNGTYCDSSNSNDNRQHVGRVMMILVGTFEKKNI